MITSGHFQVRTNVDAQLGKWIIDLIERFLEFLGELHRDAAHEFQQQDFLVGEVVVDRGASNLCPRSDLRHRD